MLQRLKRSERTTKKSPQLAEARQLLLSEKTDAQGAAYRVGYQSLPVQPGIREDAWEAADEKHRRLSINF
jgi:hypothetical protein